VRTRNAVMASTATGVKRSARAGGGGDEQARHRVPILPHDAAAREREHGAAGQGDRSSTHLDHARVERVAP
jgi:hypothetical protein